MDTTSEPGRKLAAPEAPKVLTVIKLQMAAPCHSKESKESEKIQVRGNL